MNDPQKDSVIAKLHALFGEAINDNSSVLWANYERAKAAHNSEKPFRYSFPVSVKIGPEGRDATPVSLTLSPASKSKIEASANVRMGADMFEGAK
jgi:hypothetical protein